MEDFIRFVINKDSSTRDASNFIVKDGFKFKIPKPNLVNLRVKTKQNYDYLRSIDPTKASGMDGYDAEFNDPNPKPLPQKFFDNLLKLGDSEPLVKFLQHAENLYFDHDYDVYLDDNKTQLDSTSRYIDFKLYKDFLAIEFLEDKPFGAAGKRFYTTNLSSAYIGESRVSDTGGIYFDEDFMRTSFFFQQFF